MIIKFWLERRTDVTGISGTGIVAEGCLLPSGRVVLEWRPPIDSITIHRSIHDVQKIHCHDGASYLNWEGIECGLDAESWQAIAGDEFQRTGRDLNAGQRVKPELIADLIYFARIAMDVRGEIISVRHQAALDKFDDAMFKVFGKN